MKKKGEVSQHTKNHIKCLKNKGIAINQFRADGGGECTPNELQTWLVENGIRWNPSAARTPENDSTSERGTRSIMDMVRSMLKHADLPDSHWCCAAKAAAHTMNRSPHTALRTAHSQTMSPCRAETGYAPDTSNLRTFGCMCVGHIDEDVRPPGGLGARGKQVR